MISSIRKFLKTNSLSRQIYVAARHAYKVHWVARGAGRYFLNSNDYKKALYAYGETPLVDLRTADGLTVTIGQNYSDAMTIAEVLLRHCYDRHVKLPPGSVIVDVGGFVGDFALYAVKR